LAFPDPSTDDNVSAALLHSMMHHIHAAKYVSQHPPISYVQAGLAQGQQIACTSSNYDHWHGHSKSSLIWAWLFHFSLNTLV